MDEKLLTPATHDDELGIMNVPATRTEGEADASSAPASDDAVATPLGQAGAMMRALAADDTDNDG